jgi:hypothetical protein
MGDIEKKYQVFVSSTYEDLQIERQEVIHALLELDCIPSGMELFPAADEDQWSLIKGIIDDCDYYIVIIAGRYGSIGSDGYSYTEMEYRYAMEKGKPVIAFFHKDPTSLPVKKTEKTIEGQKKLEQFRVLVQKKMCKPWETAKDLGSVVSRSFVSLQKKHPGIGWVKANNLSDKDAQLEILKLREEIDRYKSELEIKKVAPEGAENYAQGEDKVLIHYSFKSTASDDKRHSWTHQEIITWDEIFSWILPLLMDEASDSTIRETIAEFLYMKCKSKYKKDEDIKDHRVHTFNITNNDFQTVIIQARALGLIQKSERKKTIDDSNRYWTLTPYGDSFLISIRVIKRK